MAASGTADQTRSLWIHHAQSILQGNDGHSERLQTDFGLSNILRDGIPVPIPYAGNLFDYGRNNFDPDKFKQLGFAGFRIHYP